MHKTTQSPLIRMLLENPKQYISGEMISQQLGISRTAVWKQIKKLESIGYEIEAVTKLGYRLLYYPKAIDHLQIEQQLQGHRLGNVIHHYDVVDSTQVIAKQLAEEGAAEGTVVLAEQQVKGKGRLGRHWHSPYAKGIWMSVILRPQIPIQLAPQLTLLTAVALCRAMRTYSGLEIGIKWPNDLLYQGKKLSGILLESSAEDQMLKYVIAGIGIDANLSAHDYDEQLALKATSLRLLMGKEIDRTELIQLFLTEWELIMEIYERSGFRPIAELWEAYAISLGQKLNLTTPTETFMGTPLRLTDAGSIIVRLEDGTEKEIYSAEMGEVTSKSGL